MNINILIAVTMNNEKIILKAPRMLEENYLEGAYLEDNIWIEKTNIDIIPNKIGLYECCLESIVKDIDETKLNSILETGKGYMFKIIEVNTIYQDENI